ncbi:MAG TPA: serine/threonine-protein kinase, partial [Ktedonobacteraceae bacterium]|nr:serine/threonine-protein kinase [Ktedonobacteraceae bacterium]
MSTASQRLGKYELRELLGQGGMAEVWKAFDTQLHRYVAIKILHTNLQTDPGFIARFEHEARIVAALRHPNIVQIYDFHISDQSETDNTFAYMVMEYIEGNTLAHYIHETSEQQQFPPAADIVRLFTPISLALDYAHQQGTIHRDIKPANILLDRRSITRNPMGEPILSDFGLAKLLSAPSQTIAGMVFGTPLYIS